MDRRDLEPSRWLHHRKRWMLELLRDADGRSAKCDGLSQVSGADAPVGRSARLDWPSKSRRRFPEHPAWLAEAKKGVRQLNVGPLSRGGAR